MTMLTIYPALASVWLLGTMLLFADRKARFDSVLDLKFMHRSKNLNVHASFSSFSYDPLRWHRMRALLLLGFKSESLLLLPTILQNLQINLI